MRGELSQSLRRITRGNEAHEFGHFGADGVLEVQGEVVVWVLDARADKDHGCDLLGVDVSGFGLCEGGHGLRLVWPAKRAVGLRARRGTK